MSGNPGPIIQLHVLLGSILQDQVLLLDCVLSRFWLMVLQNAAFSSRSGNSRRQPLPPKYNIGTIIQLEFSLHSSQNCMFNSYEMAAGLS